MCRRWLRPVALVTLAFFLIASTPGAAHLLLRAVGGQGHRCSGCPCSCCGGHAEGDDHEEDEDSADHPASPFGSDCPNPTCWCHVAQAAYCPAAAVVPLSVPCAEPSLGEAIPVLPDPLCRELMRPPRVG
jgi:hypothetical protein